MLSSWFVRFASNFGITLVIIAVFLGSIVGAAYFLGKFIISVVAVFLLAALFALIITN